MIAVTKPWLPKRELLEKYISGIYENNWLTNFGPLEQCLTERLKKKLGVENLLLVSNGTLALQLTYRALELSGEVITTPFSFVATTSSLKWENLEPVFCDINSNTLNIDESKIERLITNKTTAILPVHVFGRACNVWNIDKIASNYGLKVIYDAAHAFGVQTKEGVSVLDYGDASILSFHATKLFHTIEGGAIISRSKETIEKCKLLANFGIPAPDKVSCLGINSKMNEFQAAMGLALLDEYDEIIAQRRRVFELYEKLLSPRIKLANIEHCSRNYSYVPVVFESERQMLVCRELLIANKIQPRRYFYPSLNTLNYLSSVQSCPVSEDISTRILCVPMFGQLADDDVIRICGLVNSLLRD